MLTLAILLLAGVAFSGCQQQSASPSEPSPRIIVGNSVASDFNVLAETTWAEFLTVFQARRGCIGDVRLEAAHSLDSRAAYDPETATVTVRVPGTPAMLKSALVHEWAHHVEFQCDEHRGMRPVFLAAQGLDPDTPWRPGTALTTAEDHLWQEMPSELYAEAAIVAVLGRRPIPTLARVKAAAVDVVKAWAEGGTQP
ncbi:MAG: hypothetical protein U9R25_02945 [Chloroflexota bacterium]|nr:hypothetical protein [Chloroflexota bacterium]